ncbi:unnamed protein product [Symbiodinium natans]|uniref:PPPDE domain-containing protein n=1 Tax=Symbiodinium natans TaxID=878477 RepID=A0A812K9Y4_9DINO|nr:unnamed protein product [Symbiodinium natans]
MGNVNVNECMCEVDDSNELFFDEMDAAAVWINIYDLNQDWLTANSVGANVLHVGGAFHAAVEVFGQEFSFGSEGGIVKSEPRKHDVHVYRNSVGLGVTKNSEEQVLRLVEEMRKRWHASDYDILYHNCCSFADEFCMELTGKGLPGWVNRLPRLLSNVDVEHVVSKAVSRAMTRDLDGEKFISEISREQSVDTLTTMDSSCGRGRSKEVCRA